jgi:hypothetical protein
MAITNHQLLITNDQSPFGFDNCKGAQQMSNRKLAILGGVAVVLVLWAVVQSRVSNRPKAEPDRPVYLIQGLDPADIGGIVVGTGENAVTLKRDKGGFVIVSEDNYPAKTSEINSLISKCLEIKTSEFITDNPANQEDLEVTEAKARSIVKFMTPEPNSVVLAGVVVGKSEELGQGTYVRLLSKDPALSNRVYVTPSAPWFASGATSFMEQELVAAKREDIESVTVNSPNGSYVLKTKEGSQDVVLENIPAGKKFKSSDGQGVFTALTSLRFDDVKRADASLKFEKQYICKLKDSTVYTLKIAQTEAAKAGADATAEKQTKTYITCEAEFTDKTPIVKGSDVETPEELKAKEAKLLARDKAQKFAADHQGWMYEISDWKAKNLTKEFADLIEDEKKPTEEKPAVEPNQVTPVQPAPPQVPDANAATPIQPAAPQTQDPNTPAPAQTPAPKTQDPNTATPKTEDPNTAQTESP